MGCIQSRGVVEYDSDPDPSPHRISNTHKTENAEAIDTGKVAATDANSQITEDHDDGFQVTSIRKVVLDDIEIECSSEHAPDMEGLMLSIVGLEDEEYTAMKKSSPTTWSWPGVITLTADMKELAFIVQSKAGNELGRLSFDENEIRGFLAVQDDLFEVDDRSPAYTPEEIERMAKDTQNDPSLFPVFLERLGSEDHGYLHLFGFYFTHKFEETGNVNDIDRAIKAYTLAMEHTTPDDLAHAIYVHAGGTGYLSRFTLYGHTSDIEQALSLLAMAASQTKDDDVALPERLSRLGIAYRVRFQATGDLVDIENAISNQLRAIKLTEANHPDRAARLASLGASFKARFDHKADLADINSAITNTEKAIGMSAYRHDDMPIWLNNLGTFYQMRFKRTDTIDDSDNGIKHQKEAIDMAHRTHPKMAAWLNNLGISYRIRFGRTKEMLDIENAIIVQTQAVGMTGDEHMARLLHLGNLGNSYLTRFRVTNDPIDIDRAIERHKQAADLTPKLHPAIPSRLGSLGNSFHSRFKSRGDKADVFNSINSFRKGATSPTGRPSTRLRNAREWGLLCRIYDPPQSMEAFTTAIGLLSQVAGLEQTIQKRYMTLTDISDLTMTAAATAMDRGEIGTAVEWLEQGRCLVWNQINQLRKPADILQEHDPLLAQSFLKLSRALEESGSRQEDPEYLDAGDDTTHLIATQDTIAGRARLAKEYYAELAKIRSISGLEGFLLPPKISDLLLKIPKDDAVVTFVVHQDRCDALVLRRGLSLPIHVPLTKMTLKRAVGMRDELYSVLKSQRVRVREPNSEDAENQSTFRIPTRVPGIGGEIMISQILEELWVKVVEDVMRSLSGGVHLERTRLWWCPTGALAFLPLHAAGIYKEGSVPGFNVLDFVVSSYTPTIRALLDNLDLPNAREIEGRYPIAPVIPPSLLLISQPNTPGSSPLPGTREEVQEIQRLINATASTGPVIRSLLLEDSDATVARVKDELKSHTWVHFACHAIQDRDSLKSGLDLHDQRLELSEIMKQRIVTDIGTTSSNPKAVTEWALAFLSACQTGTGDEKLSDEVVHIAAGMLVAGYKSIVATMWNINDAYGKDTAVGFYKHLLGGLSIRDDGHLKTGGILGAAWALDRAVSDIRQTVGDNEKGLLTWVPYVHYGA